MKTERRTKGDEGEHIALQFLLERGYHFIDANWQCRYGEIDLIMLDPKKELVFVEVKLRSTNDFGYPEEMVSGKKQRSLRKTANKYLLSKHYDEYFFRFDTIAITGTSNHYAIEHFIDTIRDEY